MFISQRITWSCLALTVLLAGVICQNETINETAKPSIAKNVTTRKPIRKGGRSLQDLHAEPTQAHANPILTLKPQFCEALQLQERLARAKRKYRRECKTFNNNNLKFFLSLFVIISWGALVRCILRATHASLPYTVVLMVTGLLVGLGSRIPKSSWPKGCEQWTIYTKIARMPPQIILYVFLPVLLFESAFSMSPHVFYRSCAQILVTALPGMLFSTFVTALVCQYFLKNYNWDFNQASLFGSIISATDPVAVVAILKELGTSEALSTMIEGESLLNDGIAILMYEIFEGIVVSPKAEGLALRILQKFCQITLGGPAFGFFMAKIAILCVSLIFNDATVEITVTLVAAYLTYYIGEAILGVSGVMAVVVLGLVMSSEKTSISPEVESLVHHFWEMLGYLANTVLFVVVGIVISETAVNAFQWTDLAYLLFLYVALNIVRLLMLVVLSPVLSRMGYGFTWQSMIVMMWGGLRGAVGICLSLEIYTNPELCDNRNIGPKFLLQTAGIVFLTLVVNGTTTQALLDCLGVTELSIGRIQDMNNAHSQIVGAQSRTITALRNDRFLADAKWDLVEKYTSIDNPYANQRKNKLNAPERSTSILSLDQVRIDHTTVCDECENVVMNEPTKEEYREMTEEARLRCLKALKVSFWRQYEQGVLTDLAVQILRNSASAAEDKPLCIIHAKDLNKYWVLRGLFPWLQIQLTRRFGKDEVLPPKPENDCRRCCWSIATSVWFEYFIMIVVILNIIPAIWETCDIANVDKVISEGETWSFFGVNCIFLLIYVLEAIIKILGRGARDYFCVDYWNYLDILLLIASFADITIALITNLRLISINTHSIRILKFVRVSRVLRAFRLLRPVLPAIMKIIDRRINEQLFLGYDVGKGFVTAVDDVIKFLPQMITHPKIQKKLRTALEHERLQTVREMGMLQKGHPGIAIAVKTRHASRAVLNQMRDALNELKEDGLIDEKENSILVTSLEEKMKRLWHSPPTIPSFPPETLLENLSWVFGNDQMLEYVKDNAELITFNFGDVMSEADEASNGIFVIVSGMVKIHYIPTANIVEAFEKFGIVPNMELFLDLTFRHEELDFFSTGTIIGEKNVLTGERRSATVTCETIVTAYHLSQEPMKQALKTFSDPYDSLESRMWRSYGIRLATALLPTQPAYAAWTLDRIRMHLERSAVPIGDKFDVMTVPEYISDVIVIHGQVRNCHTQEIYQAPALVPRACSKFGPVEDSSVQARILVIAHEEIDREEDESGSHSNTSSLHNVLANQSNIKIERTSRRFSRKSSRMSDNVSRSVKMEVVRRKSSLNRKTSKSISDQRKSVRIRKGAPEV